MLRKHRNATLPGTTLAAPQAHIGFKAEKRPGSLCGGMHVSCSQQRSQEACLSLLEVKDLNLPRLRLFAA